METLGFFTISLVEKEEKITVRFWDCSVRELSPVALPCLASAAVSFWKNSFPNWTRHHVAVDCVMVMFSGGRTVHRSAVLSSPSLEDTAHPPVQIGPCATAGPEAGSGAESQQLCFLSPHQLHGRGTGCSGSQTSVCIRIPWGA